MMRLLTICLTLGLAFRPIQAQEDIGNLFDVDFTTNDKGGCSYVGQSNMQNLVDDSYTLATVGVQLVQDYGNDVPQARRLLDSFFKTSAGKLTATQQTTLKDNYQGVATWLKDGGDVDNGNNALPPYLFCYHSWLLKRTMNDVAWDENDQPYTNPTTGQDTLIKEVPQYLQAWKDNNRRSPYWCYPDGLKEYLFDVSYGAGTSVGFCTSSGNLAATQHSTAQSTITLCPSSFGASNNNLVVSSLNRLHSVAPTTYTRSASNNEPPAGTSTLSDVQPTVATFFHELFHLVLGNTGTYPSSGEKYFLTDIVGLSWDLSSVNPESYTLAAVSYDYTLSYTVTNGGKPVEFFTGYASQEA